MPNLRAFRRTWSLSSDAIPLVAFLGWVFHVVWMVLIIIGQFILAKPSECHATPAAAHYLAMVLLFFSFYVIAAGIETGLMIIGYKGGKPRFEKPAAVAPLQPLQLSAVEGIHGISKPSHGHMV